MRRFGALLLMVGALVLAGCGSSGSSGSSNPLNTELSYFPSGSAFVMSVATDPNSTAIQQLHQLVAKFPIAGVGISALTAKLDQMGIDYQSDVRPLFGNPIMVGIGSATLTGGASKMILAAWVTKDSSKLAGLIKKIPSLHQAGSHDGAKLYEAASATAAVDGATLVVGASPAIVTAALDRHAHGAGISPSVYTQAFAGLPQGTLIQAFGSLSAILSRPSLAKARAVPWVAALRGYAATVSASASGLSFNYHLDTTGRSLTPEQVPIASGATTPHFAGAAPISATIENPAHIASFVLSVEQVTNPASFAKFQARQAALRAKTGFDITSALQLLTGELIISSDGHTTMGRAGLTAPEKAAGFLAKLATAPPGALGNGTRIATVGGGFYALHRRAKTINVGVVGDELVAGNTSVARLRAFAAAPTSPAAGAQGAIAFRIALSELLRFALHSGSSQALQQVLGSLGDLSGSVSATTSGMTGNATLALK